MIDLAALVLTCAPLVAPDTARALIQVESGGNPFAIGVVGGALVRQPANLPEALATVAALEAAGWNYSVGLGQINKRNFERYGLTPSTAFDPCANLTAMQGILGDCFSRASRRAPKQTALARRLQLLLLRQLPDRSPTRLRGQGPRSVVVKASPVRPRHRIRQPRSLAMNLTRHQPSVRPIPSITAARAVMALLVFGAALAASNPAMAQALEPVVRGATIARDTVVAITLLLMTVGVGMAGYKIMFAGASFRDVSNLLFGGAIAGAAAAIAAVFMG